MSLKNQAAEYGLTRNPALQLDAGQTVELVINLTKQAKHIKSHKLDQFIKKPCVGDGCPFCAAGAKPREVWLVDCYAVDQTTGELAGRALFLSRQEFGALAEALPDDGLNARVRATGTPATDKDGKPVMSAKTGRQYVNLTFELVK